MSADLIQAMVESFRIYGNAESNMSGEDEVIGSVPAFKFDCSLYGKGGQHKARDCP